MATLNLATTEVWNDKQRPAPGKTEWHRVVLWGKQAESLQEYLTKGKQIYVEGRLQTRQWDDKDGNKRYTTEIKADRYHAARRRRGSATAPADAQERTAVGAVAEAPWTSRRWSRSPTTTSRSAPVRPGRYTARSLRRHTFVRGQQRAGAVFTCPVTARRSPATVDVQRAPASSISGVDTEHVTQSSIAVIRCTVFGVTRMHRPAASRFVSTPSTSSSAYAAPE